MPLRLLPAGQALDEFNEHLLKHMEREQVLMFPEAQRHQDTTAWKKDWWTADKYKFTLQEKPYPNTMRPCTKDNIAARIAATDMGNQELYLGEEIDVRCNDNGLTITLVCSINGDLDFADGDENLCP